MDLLKYVGEQIRTLRMEYGSGSGLSQQALAEGIGTTANTISRWETGTYKPGLEDLEKLSRFFGVSILRFLPPEEVPEDAKLTALLRTAKQLDSDDLEELHRYAEYRRARHLLDREGPRQGRKRK